MDPNDDTTTFRYDHFGRCVVPLCERCGFKHDRDFCMTDDRDYWKPEAD